MCILSFYYLLDPPHLEASSALLASILKPLMASLCASYGSATWLALVIVISVSPVNGVAVGGRDLCPPFSCGNLHNISSPFRRPSDPPQCGVQAYELLCSGDKAIIRINTGTYFVTSIDYTGSSFWVVDANLVNMHSSCLLPRWDQLPYSQEGSISEIGPHFHRDLATTANSWACFINCSRAVINNSLYKPAFCLSTNSSFVYVFVSGYLRGCLVSSLEPSCGYLATIPFGSYQYSSYRPPANASYADIMELVEKGFSVRFPIDLDSSLISELKTCIHDTKSFFHEHVSGANPLNWTIAFFWSEIHFAQCVHNSFYGSTKLYWVVEVIVYAIGVTKLYVGICRFALIPLSVFTFLAHKYWKTKITIDAIEKFLQMQEMIGPRRYAYTDITAITSHFRDKLGQGGYGSVYKGVLLPGNVHVAIKILGNSNCNGDEFISEVSTIGRIHHINVVRLVGFCAEEMRRGLVYEYMPNGSLDKYIFSPERSFSWDKLIEISLGIARGINYLHQGCDMQILHFDIKPHNVLLDSNFVPKVADFGLAKLYPRDKSFVPTNALRGTIGYIAPEMVSPQSFGVISSKSDVYSFGMLLLEMAGGRRNADQNAGSSSQAYYPSWVYDQIAKQEAGEISAAADMHELNKKLCIIGLRCIQMRPHDRPTMNEVIEMLECGADRLQLPSRPFFCDDDQDIAVEDSYHFSSELNAISEEHE